MQFAWGPIAFGVLVSLARSIHALVLLAWFHAGCASAPVVKSQPLPSAVVSRTEETLSPDVIAQEIDAEGAYRVGPGDSLLVAVYGHPELSIATYAGMQLTGSRGAGLVIDNDGTIQFPLIGSVQVDGKTTAELRVYLEAELAKYVQEPHVTVQLLEAGSIRYYMLGQFTQPGLKYSDRPMRLLEALSLGGSVQLERASLRGAYVARGKRRLPVNFNRLLRHGDMAQNIALKTGDVVFVPDAASEQAFVFGAATGGRTSGAVPFINGQLDILQALAQAGFGFQERFQSDFSEVRVIRGEGDRGQLFVIDVDRVLEGEAAPFYLEPGDVVFVPSTGLTDWNIAMQALIPTLQAASAVLNPFVQIKFLRDR